MGSVQIEQKSYEMPRDGFTVTDFINRRRHRPIG
jgi:hypothetical protein